MGKVYFTLTGTKHYYGKEFLKPGMKLLLEKESDNEYDKEAIMVKLEGIGKLGYVANSPYTVLGDSLSAGRLYDRIGKKAYGKVILVTPQGVLCKVNKKSLVVYQKKSNKNCIQMTAQKSGEIISLRTSFVLSLSDQ